jgi:hypothetical protein
MKRLMVNYIYKSFENQTKDVIEMHPKELLGTLQWASYDNKTVVFAAYCPLMLVNKYVK